MAKTPSTSGSTPPKDTAKPKVKKAAATPLKKAKTIAPAARGPATASAKGAKPAKIAKPVVKIDREAGLRAMPSKIAELAADILADRIIPTIEQMKAIAESVLERAQSKSKKPKKKKK